MTAEYPEITILTSEKIAGDLRKLLKLRLILITLTPKPPVVDAYSSAADVIGRSWWTGLRSIVSGTMFAIAAPDVSRAYQAVNSGMILGETQKSEFEFWQLMT